MLVCFKKKTAYEMRISDWSSDVCSSDLARHSADVGAGREAPWVALCAGRAHRRSRGGGAAALAGLKPGQNVHILCARRMAMNRPARFEGPKKPTPTRPTNVSLNAALGRASCRDRVCQYV